MLRTACYPHFRVWLSCAGLLGAAPAAAQTTVVVPLTKLEDFNGTLFTRRDTTQQLRHVPKNLRHYLLKYVVLGGGPGQPPAQRLNFLIGRDAQERVVFVPAAPQTFRFRVKDQQVLATAEAPGQPVTVTLRGARGPVVVRLRPSFSSKHLTYFSPLEQRLFLTLEQSVGYKAQLPIGDKEIALQIEMHGKQAVLLTDSTASVQVPDGQHKGRFYRMGESFLASGHLITLRHISAGGDSLAVQVVEPAKTNRPFGADAGLAFQPATLSGIEGQPVMLAGTERPLVLDFWGTWCGPCVALTPSLKALHQQYATKADIVSIALDDADKVKQYLSAHAITWPNIAVPEKQAAGSLIEKLNVNNYPTFILVYKGIIIYRGTGETGLKELTQQLAQLN